MKLKNADSRIMFNSFDLSPSGVDGQSKQNIVLFFLRFFVMKFYKLLASKSPENKSLSFKPTLPSTAITKQANYTLNSPNLNIVKLQGIV